MQFTAVHLSTRLKAALSCGVSFSLAASCRPSNKSLHDGRAIQQSSCHQVEDMVDHVKVSV